MIANLVGPDLGIVVVIILVVLVGGSQLPKIARNVGLAGKEFRKAQQEAEEEEAAKQAAAAKAASAAPPPAAALTAGDSAPSVPVEPTAEEKLTLTRSELDALLKAHEQEAKKTSGGSTA